MVCEASKGTWQDVESLASRWTPRCLAALTTNGPAHRSNAPSHSHQSVLSMHEKPRSLSLASIRCRSPQVQGLMSRLCHPFVTQESCPKRLRG